MSTKNIVHDDGYYIDELGNTIHTRAYGFREVRHRDNNLPAVIYNGGGEIYYKEDEYHRTDGGPAIDMGPDDQAWYVEGKLHRLAGPAVINPKEISYYVDGKLHRLDGPAIKTKTEERYFIDGEEFCYIDEYWRKVKEYIK